MFPTAKKNRVFEESEELQIEHHFIGGVYAKRMILKSGSSINSHKHNFDHMSILASGVAMVTVDDQAKSYAAPTVIEIKAEKTHKIMAITECHWYCIHATDITDPDLIDEEIVMESKDVV